ncbi:hypothetical protein AwDysgo_19650 [Bacteroidales bacterium]|nr:hypothetical protein AwDysgo_19650 [Bacteroidales bacterium]
MKKDIISKEDLETLVYEFYARVRQDDLLKDIFNGAIKDHWDEHLEKIVRFWETKLLGAHTYSGTPFVPHMPLPIDKEHFDRWLKHFFAVVDEYFEGEKADEIKMRAGKIAETFNAKLIYIRKNSKNGK